MYSVLTQFLSFFLFFVLGLGLSPLPTSSGSSSGDSEDDNGSDDSYDFDIARRQRIPNKKDKDFIVDDMDEAEHSLIDIPGKMGLISQY